MIKIKICGIKRKEEIKYVNDLKPDYIGFVFAKSKRKVTKENAAQLSLELSKNIKAVGVFRNNSIEEIIDVLKVVPLSAVQLHGDEDEQFIKVLRNNIINSNEISNKNNIEIWKAISVDSLEYIKKYLLSSSENTLIDKFLIDGVDPGSGKTYSLSNIKNKLHLDNCFLAGGITPDNVIERIQAVNPMGIDVSSGVETLSYNNEYVKSYEKIKSLIDKVRKL